MTMEHSAVTCRACGSSELEQLPHINFRYMAFKDPSVWDNFLCEECGSVSHYIKDVSLRVTYSDSSYRTDSHTADGVAPPISLPWSAITFARYKHVVRLTEKYFERIRESVSEGERIQMLDFGGL